MITMKAVPTFPDGMNNEFMVFLVLQPQKLDAAKEWIAQNCDPDEIFSEEQLIAWAYRNKIAAG
jgi:hypothetical protein